MDIFGGSSPLGGCGPPGPVGPKGDRGPRGKLPDNIKLLKKIKVTKGHYRPHINQIQESYRLGFTPYREHTNGAGTFVSPIRIYDNNVYVLDDTGDFNISGRTMENYHSSLVYAEEVNATADNGEAVGLVGPPGPPGHVGPQCKRGPQGDDGPPGKRGAIGP